MNKRLLIWVTRCLIVLVLILMWQWGADRSKLFRFFFGQPLEVWAVIERWFVNGQIYRHLVLTLLETLLAFSIGTTLGLGAGLWLGLSRFWGSVLGPFVTGMNSMPRLILAPIFAMWFGLGIWSKVALGVTTVFFVVFFSVFQGIRDVSPVLIANVRMLGANRAQLIRRVYVPSALSWVFSSLHLSVGLAFVASIVGEYLGSSAGLGYLILQAESTFDMSTVIAGIAVLTACALTLDTLVTLIEDHLMKWRNR